MNILVTKWNGQIKPDETVVINTDHMIRAEPFDFNGKEYTQVFMTEGRFVTPMKVMEFYRMLENDV